VRFLLPVLLVLAVPASADAWSIRTPSKNIMCGDLPHGKIQCLVVEATWISHGGCHDTTPTGYGELSRHGRARVGRICVGGRRSGRRF
jgi:hypothetical protein